MHERLSAAQLIVLIDLHKASGVAVARVLAVDPVDAGAWDLRDGDDGPVFVRRTSEVPPTKSLREVAGWIESAAQVVDGELVADVSAVGAITIVAAKALVRQVLSELADAGLVERMRRPGLDGCSRYRRTWRADDQFGLSDGLIGGAGPSGP